MANRFLRISLIAVLALVQGIHCLAQDYRVPFPKPFPAKPDTVSIVMIGDVMMHQKQLSYDCRTFLEPIRPRLEKADLAIANLEFPLAGKPYSGYPAFSTPDEFPEYLADCGIDVFLAANNHVLDKGYKGLSRTIEVYDRMKSEGRIHYTGIAKDQKDQDETTPLIVAVKGIRIALINFTYGNNFKGTEKDWPNVNVTDREMIHKAVQKAKQSGVDFIFALPHWGVEYSLTHGKSQESLAKFMAEEGVDLIVGAHPHVIQDTATIGNTKVIYSMGNAVSNMSAKNTRLELMVKINIIPSKDSEKPRMLEPELEFMWCTLPGTLTDSYATIPLKEYLGKRDLWKEAYDYDNMVSTYKNVKAETGIED